MYMSIGTINIENKYGRMALRNEQDMHRSVMRMFNGKRHEEKVLYRTLESRNEVKIFIQSENAPNVTKGKEGGINIIAFRDMGPKLNDIRNKNIVNIDILLSPYKHSQKEGWKRSKRVLLYTEEERIDWVRNKLKNNGCIMDENTFVKEISKQKIHFSHKDNYAKIPVYRYQARVVIEDYDAFFELVSNGIGSEKAYGLGMFMIG